jgi:Zn-dependent M28 family amino/carboxypeptidase
MPLGQAIAMINLDMIGRLRDRVVFAGGSGTGSSLRRILDDVNREAKFKIETADTGDYGSSDHYSFMPKGIPFRSSSRDSTLTITRPLTLGTRSMQPPAPSCSTS